MAVTGKSLKKMTLAIWILGVLVLVLLFFLVAFPKIDINAKPYKTVYMEGTANAHGTYLSAEISYRLHVHYYFSKPSRLEGSVTINGREYDVRSFDSDEPLLLRLAKKRNGLASFRSAASDFSYDLHGNVILRGKKPVFWEIYWFDEAVDPNENNIIYCAPAASYEDYMDVSERFSDVFEKLHRLDARIKEKP